MDNCIFCKIASKEISSEIIYENENFFSIYDVNPEVDGHALVISKKHFKNILEMPNSLGVELNGSIKKTVIKLVEKYNADGFNIVNNINKAAGQVVDHVHFHIL